MVKDENPSEQPLETQPKEKIPPFLKKNFMIIAMFVLGIALLFPIAIFVISALQDQGQMPASKKIISKRTFAPTAPFVADQLIVKLKDSYTRDELETLNKKFTELGVVSQEKVFESEDPLLRNYFILRFKEGVDIRRVGQELISLKELEAVEPNYLIETQAIPNDPLYGQMWGFEKISMPQTWDIVNGSSSVVVAVVDTGIDYNHQDFVGRNIIKGPDFSTCDAFVVDSTTGESRCASQKPRGSDPMDKQGHGTHVAGTIGAVTNNNTGVSGTMWNVTLMAVKTIGADIKGRGNSEDIIEGIKYAVDNGADIINLSLASEEPCAPPRSLYRDTIKYAIGKGAIVVSAAGNGGADRIGDDVSNYSPASCDGVIAVSATTQLDTRPASSNWGPRVDIAAPGVNIYSTILGGSYGPKTGTSMAAPHVSGVVGLLLAANPTLSKDQILSCLVNGADPISVDKYIGPRLNAYKALTLCKGIVPLPTSVTPTVITAPTGVVGQYGINGVIFIDNNGNKIRDAGEPGYPQAQIVTDGGANLTTNPDSNGNFIFKNLPEGVYTVSAVIGGIKRISTSPRSLSGINQVLTVIFYLSPEIIAATPLPGEPLPTPIVIIPTIIVPPTSAPLTPSPTPVKTYTCREAKSIKQPLPGSIKIGNLICEAN